MSYWFGYRVYDESIDLEPGSPVLEGPFESYAAAKKEKESILGRDIKKTAIFPADDVEEANKKLRNQTWMV